MNCQAEFSFFLKKNHRYPIIFQKQVFLHFLSGRKVIFEKVVLSNTANKRYRSDNGSERKKSVILSISWIFMAVSGQIVKHIPEKSLFFLLGSI